MKKIFASIFMLFAVAMIFTTPATAKVNKEFVILIHAGHGGTDPGAIAKDGTKEEDLTLQYAKQLEKIAKLSNFKVVMCRDNDANFDLFEREALIKTHKADLFLSIHFEFNEDATIEGMECVTATDNMQTENRVLGKFLGAELYLVNGMKFNGVNRYANKTNSVNGLSAPTAMVDLGHMSNAHDLAFIKSEAGMVAICAKLLNGIQRYKNYLDGNK